MEDWTPTIGESLLVEPELTNAKDNKAVAVLKDDLVAGHVPYNLASRLFQKRCEQGICRGDRLERK